MRGKMEEKKRYKEDNRERERSSDGGKRKKWEREKNGKEDRKEN